MYANIKFITCMWKYSFKSALEYRVSSLFQIIATILNNSIYFIFWLIFFQNIVSINTYSLHDTLMQFSIVSSSFGICYAFWGNSANLSGIIVRGELDY